MQPKDKSTCRTSKIWMSEENGLFIISRAIALDSEFDRGGALDEFFLIYDKQSSQLTMKEFSNKLYLF